MGHTLVTFCALHIIHPNCCDVYVNSEDVHFCQTSGKGKIAVGCHLKGIAFPPLLFMNRK